MSRRSDLEGSIRESYGIIREYEDTIQTSNRPEEKLRARRAIDQQWELIREYMGELQPLAGGVLPADIAEIAAHFSTEQTVVAQPALDPARFFDRQELRHRLIDRCNLDDLKDLCFALDLDDDNYPSAKDAFVRELLRDLHRQGRVEELVNIVRREKPWVLE